MPLKRAASLVGLLSLCVAHAWADERHPVFGLVLEVDRPHHALVVSCKRIPGFMDAMVMSYTVRDPKELDAVQPGKLIDFTLVVGPTASYVENIRIHQFQNPNTEPMEAQRLELLHNLGQPGSSPVKTLAAGEAVPDFALIDQDRKRVVFSQFAGKVVAITFIYTRCPLPDFCFRLSNNFSLIQKRFQDRMGRDLVLLSITFDPAHDRPEVLEKYAQTWKTHTNGWYFLTGPVTDVQKVCHMFGMNFWPDEGLITHTLHTVIIDQDGKVAADLEGNEFTAPQLGDLIETVMGHPRKTLISTVTALSYGIKQAVKLDVN